MTDLTTTPGELTTNQQAVLTRNRLIENASLLRPEIPTKLFDDRRDIDIECGYPKSITPEQYRYLYDREGVARRVVQIFPEESWAVDPKVREDDEADQTEFEEAWEDLQRDRNIYHYMHRVDEISGIGRFGVLFLGFSDGEKAHMAVKVEEGLELMFLRAFDEDVVTVDSREADPMNPRFGQPTLYTITFQDLKGNVGGGTIRGIDSGDLSTPGTGTVGTGTQRTIGQITMKVHWERVLHVADNRETSEVFGTPRMQPVYNRIYDIRKVLSGSGEMFWKGAFPGYSFEINPSLGDAELDAETLRTEFANYSNGLQRYLALTGVTAKSLAPQVADPSKHVQTILENIAITLGVPKRKFLGSEQAQLASGQDAKTWNIRIARRQDKYLTPMLIRPFINRLIEFKVLPTPADEKYNVDWPDLNAVTDEEKAKVAAINTKALATYLTGGVDQLIPPAEFMTLILGIDPEMVDSIMEAAEEFMKEQEEDDALEEDDVALLPPGQVPPAVPAEEDDEGEEEEVGIADSS